MKKYLTELMKDIEIPNNTLIIAPTGSGKTHYIFNTLLKGKKALYLCDNNNLLEQVLLEGENNTKVHRLNEIPRGFTYNNTDITVMTYKRFGIELSNKKVSYSDYDIVVADEIHNLIDYEGFCNDKHLYFISRTIFEPQDTQLVYFTATPYYLQELEKVCPDINSHVGYIDFTNEKDIVRYTELSREYFSSYKQIPTIFERIQGGIKYLDKKVLIYTRSIETMLKIQDLIKDIDYVNSMALWSVNNVDYPLSEEQERVRKHLIKTGELPSPYNVLIINRAFETGVNFHDEKMMYCIINTTNITEQVQVRGRIRHDIISITLKTDKNLVQKDVYNIDQFLDKPLTKEDKDGLCEYLNLFDNCGRLLKWTRVKNLLKERGFKIQDKTMKRNGERFRVSIISK